ncbi:hypothetical protein BH23ACT5_BH23ACT5_22630 [soil metagenome]
MTWSLAVAAIVSLVAAAWLRAAGSAIAEIPRADAHHDAAEGVRGARSVAALLDDRARIPQAVGMVGTALLVVAAVLGVVTVNQAATGRALVVAIVGVAVVVVGFGDATARVVGRRRARWVGYRSGPLLTAAVKLGGWAAEAPVDENGNSNGGDEYEEDDEEELALISSVLRFSETIVREVMVPRPDMVTVPVDARVPDITAAAISHGFSRFPVVEGDEVVGLLLVKDLLPVVSADADAIEAGAIMRPAAFIPEVKGIPDLLAEMRSSKTHMAIVVDEFGGIAGLVTIEDILEELVGEIADETDDDETWVEELEDGRWKVDARLAVEDLSELVGVEFPEGDWDTVAGLVLALAERVPEEAEEFYVDDTSLMVARMQGRRVAEVIVNGGVVGR